MNEAGISRKVLVIRWHKQLLVAVMENGTLAELQVGQMEQSHLVGNIYKGRVMNVLPGMQAAFVDIGLKRNAFLHVGDIVLDGKTIKNMSSDAAVPSIERILHQGQEILVQVIKEPVGTKGAKISMQITLPGHKLVLMPTVSFIGISHRIEGEDKNEALAERMRSVCPPGMGLILRTAAEEASPEELRDECAELLESWRYIEQIQPAASAPALIYKDASLLTRVVRDHLTEDVDQILVNDAACFSILRQEAMQMVPALCDRIVLNETDDLFDAYQLSSKMQKALARRVWLPCGGYIVIDQTEALTAIDVNTGKYIGEHDLDKTILRTNMEAASEIAHQLRLRNLSGIIIVDFIDMRSEDAREKVLQTLKEALKQDRIKTNVLGMTRLGLVELTRKKRRNSLAEHLLAPCAVCEGTGTVLDSYIQVLRIGLQIQKLSAQGARILSLRLHPRLLQTLRHEGFEEEWLSGETSPKAIYLVPDWRIPYHTVDIQQLLELPSEAERETPPDGCEMPIILQKSDVDRVKV